MAPVWRYLVSNTDPVTPTAAANNVTCNDTVPATFSP